MFLNRRNKKKKIPNDNYKREDQLTDDDYKLIDMDRCNSGIYHHSDEYYYNNILYYNYE